MKFAVVVPWHRKEILDKFLKAWGVTTSHDWLFLEHGTNGCAQTKNAGIKRALDAGAEYIIVLDDDCYPAPEPSGQPREYFLQDFAAEHVAALRPQDVRMVFPTTVPQPRGMPYRNWSVKVPVAASIGLWVKNPDFDAMTALVLGPETPVTYARMPFFMRYFPFCGMNFAFHRDWADCAVLIDVPRFDDIWMGWIWEKVAYGKGHCFNLAGPLVTHARQSDVWKNLEDEVKYLKVNEDLWSTVHNAPVGLSADDLRHMMFDAPKVAAEKLGDQAFPHLIPDKPGPV